MSLVKQAKRPRAKAPWRNTVDSLQTAETNAGTPTDRYGELLRKVHGGNAPDQKAIAEMLLAAGKSSQQFEADLVKLDRIAELKAIVAKAPEIQEALAKLGQDRTAEMESEQAERLELEQRHLDSSSEFIREEARLRKAWGQSGAAKDELNRLEKELSAEVPKNSKPVEEKSEVVPHHFTGFANYSVPPKPDETPSGS